MRFVVAVVGVLVVAGALASCSGNCERPPCPSQSPALTLLLQDAADGGPVTDGVVNGQPCPPGPHQGVRCECPMAVRSAPGSSWRT